MTYTATAEWDGHNWVAELDGHDGAVTQARRIELLRARLVEVIRLVTGDHVDVGDVELHFDELEGADELRAMRADMQAIEATLAERTPKLAQALRRQGFTVRDIGDLLGVSHQRVQQILRSPSSARDGAGGSRRGVRHVSSH